MPTLAAQRAFCAYADSVMQITAVRRRRADFSSLIHLPRIPVNEFACIVGLE
jgi:hypothetical protein